MWDADRRGPGIGVETSAVGGGVVRPTGVSLTRICEICEIGAYFLPDWHSLEDFEKRGH